MDNNKIIVVKNYDEISKIAAEIIRDLVSSKPEAVLGFATGSSPIGMYKLLCSYYAKGELDCSNCTGFNLDEYVGLDKNHSQSYYYFMKEQLYNHIPFKKFTIPNGVADDLESECANYDRLIEEAGGIDLQVLGIGENGHIGFNEPSDTWIEETHIVDLTPSTISANSRLFDYNEDLVPKKALTMGIGSIMKAKSIIVLVSGNKKAAAVKDAINGEVTPLLPASKLQEHADVTWILDEDAASMLE